MSLLESLGLPRPKALVGAGKARPQASVTLVNATGSDMRLLRADLAFKTARFVPAAPAVIPAHERVTFRVVEDKDGAPKTGGSAKYHIEQRRHKVDVTFSWADGHGDVSLEGSGHALDEGIVSGPSRVRTTSLISDRDSPQ